MQGKLHNFRQLGVFLFALHSRPVCGGWALLTVLFWQLQFSQENVLESAELGRVLSCFLYQKTWFSFAVEYGTLLKECVVASSDTFIVELEDLVSDLSYVRYITHRCTHTRNPLLCKM